MSEEGKREKEKQIESEWRGKERERTEIRGVVFKNMKFLSNKKVLN